MKQSGLPLRGIAVFETVARLGSLKAAARELNLSPSAVSHQIRALEEQLGVELFKRVSRGVQLSADAAIARLHRGPPRHRPARLRDSDGGR